MNKHVNLEKRRQAIYGWLLLSPAAVLLSLFFSMAVGLFFGIYPAYRASRLNPIDALRYE